MTASTAKSFDYLLIGQGLAGTCLAFTLQQRGHSVLVVDQGLETSASSRAAGAIHPMIFKRLTLKWKADELFPFALSFYEQLGELVDRPLVHRMRLLKVLATEKDGAVWQEAAADRLSPFLEQALLPPGAIPGFDAPFGGGWVNTAGRIRLEHMIPGYRAHLQQHQQLVQQALDPSALIWGEDERWHWEDYTFKQVVYCEGRPSANSPFAWLPFKPAKGEYFVIRLQDHPLHHMLNRGVILVPLDQERVWAGATYAWEDLSLDTTTDGALQMEQKLAKVVTQPYEVLEHKAGVRPATLDRRPFLGRHPLLPETYVFNGLGTRGVLLAPYFARQLADFMAGQGQLDPEVNIVRYAHLFSEQTTG